MPFYRNVVKLLTKLLTMEMKTARFQQQGVGKNTKYNGDILSWTQNFAFLCRFDLPIIAGV